MRFGNGANRKERKIDFQRNPSQKENAIVTRISVEKTEHVRTGTVFAKAESCARNQNAHSRIRILCAFNECRKTIEC